MSNDPRRDHQQPDDEIPHDERPHDDAQWNDATADPLPLPGELTSVEEAIRAAGAYVVPSDDLRPRTLEAARQFSEERRGGIQVGRFAAVLLLCIVASAPIAQRLTAWYERVAAPSSAQLQDRALEIAADRNIGPHWGLFEAFSQLRRGQAARLGQPSVK